MSVMAEIPLAWGSREGLLKLYFLSCRLRSVSLPSNLHYMIITCGQYSLITNKVSLWELLVLDNIAV